MFSCLRCCAKDSYTINKPITRIEPAQPDKTQSDQNTTNNRPRYPLPTVILPSTHKDTDQNGFATLPKNDTSSSGIQPPSPQVITKEQTGKEILEKRVIQPPSDDIIEILNATQLSASPSIKHDEATTTEIVTKIDDQHTYSTIEEPSSKEPETQTDENQVSPTKSINIEVEVKSEEKPEYDNQRPVETTKQEHQIQTDDSEDQVASTKAINIEVEIKSEEKPEHDNQRHVETTYQEPQIQADDSENQVISTNTINIEVKSEEKPEYDEQRPIRTTNQEPQIHTYDSEDQVASTKTIDIEVKSEEKAEHDDQRPVETTNQEPQIQTDDSEDQVASTKTIDIEVEVKSEERLDTQNITTANVRIYVPPKIEETPPVRQVEEKIETITPINQEATAVDAFVEDRARSPEGSVKHASFDPVIETIPLTQDTLESDEDLTDNGNSARTSTSEQLEGGDLENTGVRREGFRQPVDINNELEIKVHPKTEDDKLCIKNAIAANEFLENILKENNLDAIIDAMYPKELNDGDVIIEEGEPGNHLYISDNGTFEVYIANKLVNTFNDKRVFGELAVLYNSRRMATIKAATNAKVWVLHRTIYQQSLVKDAVKYHQETKSFLEKVPLVNKLNEEKLNKIANLLRKEFFKTGKVIVQEGDEGDKFYIIRAGSVTVTKEGEGKVAELSRGAFFGERALLYADRRQATVTADGPVECLTLTRSEFLEHFDDRVLEQPETQEVVQEVTKPESVQPTGKYSDIEISSLEIVRTLGVGGFGRVELVQHKYDKNLTFALKYLRKVDMVQQGQIEHVFNEKNIQIQCDSSFIAHMYKTFQDGKYLYFLMESCLGGDLWSFLQKRRNKCVPNSDARFYAACVLEALAYLHERNFIFRDLKPENLLIDSQGYLKLTDFGFAKYLGSTVKTFTFAGTPEYVAPEIIYNKGHEKSVDYWAFGVLIFELLVGRTPFRAGDDHMKTYNRILRGINSVQFPPTVSRSACHIIVKLCRPTPTERLGAQKNGIADIRNHKWFQGFDWIKLRNRKLKAPFVPKLSSNIDTRYFEYFKPDTDIPPAEPTEFPSF